MLDQSFSAKNFETIFTLLNRQGKVEIDAMSEDYRAIVGEIHAVNEEIKLLCKSCKNHFPHLGTRNQELLSLIWRLWQMK